MTDAPTGNQETNTWAMILHLSMLSGYIIPLAGLVAPIVIWQIKKNEMPELDAHGKAATNWIISAFIYGIIGAILVIVFIGIFVLMALGIMTVVFSIIAGIKASNGEHWDYPLSIRFIK